MTNLKSVNSDVLICIFNYRLDNNAKNWLHLLLPHFETVVLDSGNVHNDPEFIQFPNIYYSGLFNEMKKLSEKKDYKWVGMIPSDITMVSNKNELINKINWLTTTTNIGLWQPSLDKTSRIWADNVNTSTYKYESKKVLESHFLFIKKPIIENFDYIDLDKNKYGFGIPGILAGLSLKLHFGNIFDNTIQIHHPNETGYDIKTALKQQKTWMPEQCKKYKLDYKYLTDIFRKNNSLGEFDIKYNRNIIVSMTSWKKRINNIPVVCDLMIHQSVKPNKIVINLTESEFENRKLPVPVQHYINYNPIIEINWLKNNTKVWKKIIPTMVKYKDSVIICIDDDFNYPLDMIENLYNDFINSGFSRPISGNSINLYGMKCHCGCSSLVSYKFFDWDVLNCINDDIIRFGSSDIVYSYAAKKNGSEYIKCNKEYFINMKSFNENDPYSKNSNVNILETYNSICNSTVKTDILNHIIEKNIKYLVVGINKTNIDRTKIIRMLKNKYDVIYLANTGNDNILLNISRYLSNKTNIKISYINLYNSTAETVDYILCK